MVVVIVVVVVVAVVIVVVFVVVLKYPTHIHNFTTSPVTLAAPLLTVFSEQFVVTYSFLGNSPASEI